MNQYNICIWKKQAKYLKYGLLQNGIKIPSEEIITVYQITGGINHGKEL